MAMSGQRRHALRSFALSKKDVWLFAGLLVLLGSLLVSFIRQAQTVQAGALQGVQVLLSKTAPSSTNTNMEFVFTLATAIDPVFNNCSGNVTSTSCFRLRVSLPATSTLSGVGSAFSVTGTAFATSTASDGYFGCNGSNSDVCAKFVLPSNSDVAGGQIIVTEVVTSTVASTDPNYPDRIDVYFGTNTTVPAGTDVYLRFFNGRFMTPGFRADHQTGYADFHPVSVNSALCTGFNGVTCSVSSTYDSGSTFAAIIEPTTLSATINAAISFNVSGLATSTDVYGNGSVLTDVGSTTTTCPFGILTPNVAKVCAQRLQYTTTAQNGAVIYVTQDGNMTNGTNDIDTFKDGTRVAPASATAWTSPAANVADENTYGHLGYNSTSTAVFSAYTNYAGLLTRPSLTSNVDDILAAAQLSTGLDARVATLAAATTTVQNTNVAYKIEVSSLQEAGTYSNEIQYQYVASY